MEAAEIVEQGAEMTQVHEGHLENSHRERDTLSVCTTIATNLRSHNNSLRCRKMRE